MGSLLLRRGEIVLILKANPFWTAAVIFKYHTYLTLFGDLSSTDMEQTTWSLGTACDRNLHTWNTQVLEVIPCLKPVADILGLRQIQPFLLTILYQILKPEDKQPDEPIYSG